MTKFKTSASSSPDFTVIDPLFSIGEKMEFLRYVCTMTAGAKIDETTEPKPSWLPRQAICTSKHKVLPDAYSLNGFCCLSSKFRDFIEAFDPDCHQFFPIRVASKYRLFKDQIDFLFNACIIKDSIDTSESEFKFRTINDKRFVYDGQATTSARVLRKHLGPGNIWREELYLNDLYLSNDFYYAAISSGLKGLKNRYVVEAREI